MDEREPAERSGRSGAAGSLSPALARAIAELRSEVATSGGDNSRRRPLSNIIRGIVHQARADGLRAEGLVIVFRRVWIEMTPASPGHPELRVDRLVSALITAFYEDQAPSSA